MSAALTLNSHEGKSLVLNSVSLILLLAVPIAVLAQAGEKKLEAKAISAGERTRIIESDSPKTEQRALAISLVTTLANEARSFDDLALRPHVLAGAADTLWDADNNMARVLFRRAWEAAERGDTEEVTLKTKDNPPPMVVALRRAGGRDLRSEVLTLAARRDSALGEEFLGKLKDETDRAAKDSKGAQTSRDSWSSSEAASKRLQLASKLLNDGQIESALSFAAPALDMVNANSIGFLDALRAKSPDLADQRFALLLARAEFDPSSDANTVSGLSSYAFTPGFYVTFSADGGATWKQGDSIGSSPPNLAPALRSRFFQTAASILLRPVLPPDQDSTSSGHAGKYMVIKRLLPLFDQYAPDAAAGLRAQLTALRDEGLKNSVGDDSSLVTNGVRPKETGISAFAGMQDRLDHAKTSKQRDEIYADVAVTLADEGDSRALDLAEKIDDSDRRAEIHQYVNFEFVQRAIRKKEVSEIARLANAEPLTHTQRAWAYTQASAMLMDSERQRAEQFLEEAAEESRRIDGDKPDRTVLLIVVAAQFVPADKVRAWEMMSEVVKAANSATEFTGDNMQLTFPMATKSGIKFTSIGGRSFGLAGVFRLLAREDLYRSIDLAKTFKNDAPRATAMLAIASALLEK